MVIHLAALSAIVYPFSQIVNSISNSWNAVSGRDLQRELEEKRQEQQAKLAIINANTNLEIAAKQRELQGNIALNAL